MTPKSDAREYMFRFGREDYIEVLIERKGDCTVVNVRRRGECIWRHLTKLAPLNPAQFAEPQWRTWLRREVEKHYGLPQLQRPHK